MVNMVLLKSLLIRLGWSSILKLDQDCALGGSTRWYGWQCKWYDLPRARAIGTTRKDKIVDGLNKSQEIFTSLNGLGLMD